MKKTEKTCTFFVRPALAADVPMLRVLIERSARALSVGFYTQQQTEAVTREVFGVDSQLVEDGTYLVIEDDGAIVACGGWGKRSTSYGGDQAKSAPERVLDPATEAAKIRAFFVDPAMARRGLGKTLMRHCAQQAAASGFGSLELVATMPGEPLYRVLGFVVTERFDMVLGQGVRVPVARMRRAV
ncbi:MAG: GNAT family N-acetyltransferase [Massilia sp.]|nr:GNAT family N-acetyltransferase [Massilia sp.]